MTQLAAKSSPEPQTHLFGPSLNELSASDLNWLRARARAGGQSEHLSSRSPARSRHSRQQCSVSEQALCPSWKTLATLASVLWAPAPPLAAKPSQLPPAPDAHLEAPTGREEVCRGPEDCSPGLFTPAAHFLRSLSAE